MFIGKNSPSDLYNKPGPAIAARKMNIELKKAAEQLNTTTHYTIHTLKHTYAMLSSHSNKRFTPDPLETIERRPDPPPEKLCYPVLVAILY